MRCKVRFVWPTEEGRVAVPIDLVLLIYLSGDGTEPFSFPCLGIGTWKKWEPNPTVLLRTLITRTVDQLVGPTTWYFLRHRHRPIFFRCCVSPSQRLIRRTKINSIYTILLRKMLFIPLFLWDTF